jgi:hypothetical protein
MLCPKGHDSEDNDFCSVCGVKLSAAQPAAAPPAGEPCPDCGTSRHNAASAFCEDCGYNFNTAEHGEPPTEKTEPEPPPVLTEWEAEVTIDASLKTAESPEPPVTFQPSTVLLMRDSYLIGRRSDRRGIFPEISLDSDDAVSHRHALINRTPDGGLLLRDIGSSNGTRINGADIAPLTDTPLKDGDIVTVGHWSRIALRRVS